MFAFTMNETAVHNVKRFTCSDAPTENYHPIEFQSAPCLVIFTFYSSSPIFQQQLPAVVIKKLKVTHADHLSSPKWETC